MATDRTVDSDSAPLRTAEKPEPAAVAGVAGALLSAIPDLGQGVTFYSFILDAVNEETNRRVHLEARARGVEQTSSVAIGVVAAGGALLLGDDFALAYWSAATFAMALAALVISFAYALVATRVTSYATRSISMIRGMLTTRWFTPEPHARFQCASALADIAESMRMKNDNGAEWLEHAGWIQLAGIVLLIVTLILAVLGL